MQYQGKYDLMLGIIVNGKLALRLHALLIVMILNFKYYFAQLLLW